MNYGISHNSNTNTFNTNTNTNTNTNKYGNYNLGGHHSNYPNNYHN